MAVRQPQSGVRPEEYLALEREASFKSEYLDGVIYAMAGGTVDHSTIAGNLIGVLFGQLTGKPCRVLTSDSQVRSRTSDGLFAYPDVAVVCGDVKYHDKRRDVATNPMVIVEVLSPSTEAFDRGRKFEKYQTIESLKDYVLVAQDRPRIELYSRQTDNQWLLTTVEGLESSLLIPSIECTLALSQVYNQITFEQQTEPELPA
jgi:Uma2 family endonuclease